MARNAAGTYTLPAGNPVESATTIATSWANPTLEDVATALQDSLSRTGKGAMLAPFKAVSGLSTAPGITFNQEPQSGFYRAGAGDLRVALSGIDIFRLFNGQVQIWIPANSRWFNLVSAKGSGAVVETATLTTNQTVVEFTKNIAGAALYVNGTSGDRGRLFLDSDYTYDAVENEVTLAASYTDGTLLAAVVNDETDVQAAADAASASAVAGGLSETASENSATASENSATASENSAQSIAASAQAIEDNTTAIGTKADQATTYTKTEANSLLNAKAAISGQTFMGSIAAPNLSGTNTGDQTNISGNAGTVSNISTAQVGGATAGLGAGAVGTYVLGRQSSQDTDFGDTASGSSILPVNAEGGTGSGYLSGTWRCMGHSFAGGNAAANVTVFLRIS